MHLGKIELGDIRVDAIDGGAVWMDGGGIFGVVPKVLWGRMRKYDSENRVRLAFFSLLVRTGDATVVIEGGAAAHKPVKEREYHIADESRLAATLAELGVDAGDVDFFIPSHLHFDHVGGASSAEGGRLTFPNATHVIQRAEWDEAWHPAPISKNAYPVGDIQPLARAKLELVDGEAEVTPGVRVTRTGGHSVGHQMITVGRKGGPELIFIGDIMPTSEHVSPRWLCAFDLYPCDSLDVKLSALERAVKEGVLIAPGHGGMAPIMRVSQDDKGRYIGQRHPDIAAMPEE